MRIEHIIRALCVVAATAVIAAASRAEVRHYVEAGRSSVVYGSAPRYAADGIAFSDVDGDGAEEVVRIDQLEMHGQPRTTTFVSITKPTRRRHSISIDWRADDDQDPRFRKVLVGNLDGDPLDEVVMFQESGYARGDEDTLRVVQWNGAEYEETGTNRVSGRLGVLLDFDGDRTMEIVLTQVELRAEAGGTEPATLVVTGLRDGGFAKVADLALPNGVVALAAGDLDGDGRDEIVTCEDSFAGVVGNQIAVYGATADGAIERIYQAKGMIGFPLHLGVFESGGLNHLLVEHSLDSRDGWMSVFRLEGSKEAGYELVPAKWDRPGLLSDAARSTMAYSPARDAYARYIDGDKLEFVPAAETGPFAPIR